MRITIIAAIAAIAGLLGACNAVRVINSGGYQNYYDGAWEYATQDQKVDLVVLGSSFDAASVNFPVLVAENMKGATRGRTITFNPVGWTKPDNSFRVIALFNGKSPFIAENVCQSGNAIMTDPAAETASLYLTFCQGEYLISYANGLSPKPKSPEDPKFRELIRSVALAMIPPADYDRLDGGGMIP